MTFLILIGTEWTVLAYCIVSPRLGSATYISGTEGGSFWVVNAQDEIYEWYKGWTSNRCELFAHWF